MEIEQLIHKLSNEARPVKPMANPWRLTSQWILGFVAYLTLLLVTVETPRDDIMLQLGTPLFALEIMALVLTIIACALGAALLSYPDLYQSKRIAYLPIIAFILFAGIVVAAFIAEGNPMELHPAEFWCTSMITLYSLPPAIWLFYSIQRFASTHFSLAGSVAVLTAFSIGALALRLTEKTDSMAHVLAYHYLPMLAVGAFGLALGRKFLRW